MKNIPQEEYYNFLQKMVLCCIDVVIYQSNRVLLVKRKTEPAKNYWWFPGGRIYKGESLIDCAKRKAIEETGLSCDVKDLIYTDETVFNTGPDGIPVHSINVVYLLYPKNSSVVLDEHSSDYKWIDKIDLSFHPYVQKCLQKVGLKYVCIPENNPTEHIYY